MKRLALALAVMSGAAQADTLILALPASPGGADYRQALTRFVLAPAKPVAVRVIRLPDRALAAPTWDLAELDPVRLAQDCASGAIAKIDWSKLGGRSRFLPMAASDCGVGAYIHSTVLSWDQAHVPGAPNWMDFWNVARMPGQRGLRRSPVGTLEIALLADGVASGDVYTVLRGHDGVDRAFRKLDQLRPYIVWWRDDAEPMTLLAAGHVLMTSAPADRVSAASRYLHRQFGLQWAGSLATVQSWAIGATSKRKPASLALIAAASAPAVQAHLAAATTLGATVAIDPQALAPALAAATPSSHLDGAVPFDAGFWRDNGAALTARFDVWLKH
jgi:putative spermidine/putrescine transport system substrate-binding protein